MPGKNNNKKKKQNKNDIFDFGTCEFYCKDCDLKFEVDWRDIFSSQEITHGYVGFELQNEYIACPKCGENANEKYVS